MGINRYYSFENETIIKTENKIESRLTFDLLKYDPED